MRQKPTPQRSRGNKAGLNLARIVEAARSLDCDALTMQAVADLLGVDRKALNHHVGNREALLELVALDAFSSSFSAVQIAAHSRWQDACRTYAMGFVDSMIAVGALADHLQLGDPVVTTRFLQPTEAILKKMLEAGFDAETAQRSLALLSNICTAYARDTHITWRSGQRPRPFLLREALKERDVQGFENLARLAAAPVDSYDRQQLAFSIDVFVTGLDALVLTRRERD